MCDHPFAALTVNNLLYQDGETLKLESSVICTMCGALFTASNGHQRQASIWHAPLGLGPGTILKAKLAAAGYTSCDKCVVLARRMNAWGAACAEHMDQIVDDIFSRAKPAAASKHPWVARLLGAVGAEEAALKTAIRLMVEKAVEEWAALS